MTLFAPETSTGLMFGAGASVPVVGSAPPVATPVGVDTEWQIVLTGHKQKITELPHAYVTSWTGRHCMEHSWTVEVPYTDHDFDDFVTWEHEIQLWRNGREIPEEWGPIVDVYTDAERQVTVLECADPTAFGDVRVFGTGELSLLPDPRRFSPWSYSQWTNPPMGVWHTFTDGGPWPPHVNAVQSWHGLRPGGAPHSVVFTSNGGNAQAVGRIFVRCNRTPNGSVLSGIGSVVGKANPRRPIDIHWGAGVLWEPWYELGDFEPPVLPDGGALLSVRAWRGMSGGQPFGLIDEAAFQVSEPDVHSPGRRVLGEFAWEEPHCKVTVPGRYRDFVVEARVHVPGNSHIRFSAPSLVPWEELFFQHIEQTKIGKGLIRYMQDGRTGVVRDRWGKTNLNLSTGGVDAPPYRTRAYPLLTYQKLRTALEEWPQLTDGFEWAWEFTRSTRRWVVFPKADGGSGSWSTVPFIEGINVGRIELSTAARRTHMKALANTSGPVRQEASAVVSGFSGTGVEEVFAAPTDAPLNALEGLVEDELARRQEPTVMEVFDVKERPFPVIGFVTAGDRVRVFREGRAPEWWRLVEFDVDPVRDVVSRAILNRVLEEPEVPPAPIVFAPAVGVGMVFTAGAAEPALLEGVQGSGELSIPGPVVEGVGNIPTVGAGELVVSGPGVEGEGTLGPVSGSGELTIPGPVVEGDGGVVTETTGSGELLASGPSVEGVGVVGPNEGSGELVVSAPIVEGVGSTGTAGSGELLVPGPVVEGVGELGPVSGSGELLIPGPVVDGTGEVEEPELEPDVELHAEIGVAAHVEVS